MIEQRRAGAPWEMLRERNVPPDLEAVIRKCLAPESDDRYETAAQLAADLHAVADDAPLRFAREPLVSRVWRWASRHRRGLALAVPLIAGAALAISSFVNARDEERRREDMARLHVEHGLSEAEHSQFVVAASHFAMAEEFAGGSTRLQTLAEQAHSLRRLALDTHHDRTAADALFERLEPLRFRLITGNDLKPISGELESRARAVGRLDRGRLEPVSRAGAARPCPAGAADRGGERDPLSLGGGFGPGRGPRPRPPRHRLYRPGAAVRRPARPLARTPARYDRVAGRDPSADDVPETIFRELSARECYELGFLALIDGRREAGLAWLSRAVRLRPDHFWYQFSLAVHLGRNNEIDKALSHYDAAIAVRPDSAWALLNRAQLYWSKKRAWGRALEDLERAGAGTRPGSTRWRSGWRPARLP